MRSSSGWEPLWQIVVCTRHALCRFDEDARGRRFGAERVRGSLRGALVPRLVLSSLIDLGRTLIYIYGPSRG